MPRRGGKRKKTRTHAIGAPDGATVVGKDGKAEGLSKQDVPRSIVAKVSKVDMKTSELILDMRKLMGPYTATNLKEKRSNRMKDYTSVASSLGVSHLLGLSQTASNTVMRIAKIGTGPTLHFKVTEICPVNQVRKLQKKPFDSTSYFSSPPLVILNDFGQVAAQHVQLMRATFQHMYPSIDVDKVQLKEARRVVLFNYRKEDDKVEMRHYAIRNTTSGVSKQVRNLLKGKLPKLGELHDLSEYFEGGAGLAGLSDSEAEDEEARVELPQKNTKRGKDRLQLSAVKLTEIGPRVTLELFKVEKDVCEGEILYHKFVHKTAEEALKTKRRLEAAASLKAQRKATQEENVKRKREEKEKKKEAKRAKYVKREQEGMEIDEDDQSESDDVNHNK